MTASSMKRHLVLTVVLTVLGVGVCLLGNPSSISAGPSEQVPLGARAVAMGGAFSSVADDGTALFWNPAGLVQIGNQEISAAYADLYGSGIRDNFLAFVLPLSPTQAVAADWYHSGFGDSELDFGENRFDLAYALRLRKYLAAGLTGKFLTRSTDLDGFNVRSGRGVGMDLGLLATPADGVRVGLAAQDVFDTEITYSDGGGSSKVLPRNVRVGASYSPRPWVTVALDVDDRYHLGSEFWLLDRIALRGGIEKDRDGSEDACYGFGAGFKVGVFRFDYAFVHHPSLGGTSHLGLSMAFNFNPSKIRIEKVAARDLYMSLHKSYAKDAFGSVVLRNLDEKPVTARLDVFIPEVMDAPSGQEILLRPKASQEFPLTAVLPDEVMTQSGDHPVEVRVTATYQSQRLMRTEKTAARCVAYGPGAIDWGQGAAQIAAFVTARDPAVDGLARSACGPVALKQAYPLGNRNIGFASAIFNALSVAGVAYVPDPNNPYRAMAETPHAVDTVHYPRETLASRSGDCDDTSALVAALLGNVGIASKVVDVPGHMFLMFDTGVHERNRSALGIDEDMYVISDDGVWIPIETTAVGKGFPEAWRIGAESYASWAGRGRLELVDVAASQLQYEPSELPAVDVAPVSLDLAKLGEMTAEDIDAISGWRETHLAARYGDVDKAPEASGAALGEVAHVYFLAGRLEDARAKLEEVSRRDPTSALAHNNLAVLCVAEGDVDGALGHCRAALEADAADPGIWLNLGLIEYATGDTAAATQALAKGIGLGGGYAQACKLLGVAPGEESAVGAAQKMSEEEARLLLKAAFKKVPGDSTVKRDTAPVETTPAAEQPARAAKPAQAVQTRVAGVRAGDQMELGGILYWKE
jgi:tetratricopeptide (TPR) repeat protein